MTTEILGEPRQSVTASQGGGLKGPALVSPSGLDSTELIMRADGDTLIVSGDVDLYEAPRFRVAAEEHITTSSVPRFDMSEVAFLDSAGLATLLYLSRKAAGLQKTLQIKIGGGPRRVLRITGIDRMLSVED